MAEDVTASYSLARHVVRGGLSLSPLPTQPSNDWKCTPSCRFASLHRREASRSAPYTQPAFAFSQHSPEVPSFSWHSPDAAFLLHVPVLLPVCRDESTAKAAGEPPEQMPPQHWLQGWIRLDILQPEMPSLSRPFKAAAASLGVESIVALVNDMTELQSYFTKQAREPNSGLVVFPDAFTQDHRAEIAGLAARYRIPTIHWGRSLCGGRFSA
jgi:hypothetical protein